MSPISRMRNWFKKQKKSLCKIIPPREMANRVEKRLKDINRVDKKRIPENVETHTPDTRDKKRRAYVRS